MNLRRGTLEDILRAERPKNLVINNGKVAVSAWNGDAVRLRDIEILLTVAQLRSFTKAAEQLCLTQPAISQSVKRIEEEFGMPVFVRSKTAVEISDAGRKAISALARIHDIYLSGFKHQRVSRQIKIGMSTLLYGIDIAPIIESLRAIGIDQVEIEIGLSDRLAGRADLDVAILSSRAGPGDDRSIVMAGCWLGRDTGTQIRFKTEYDLWTTEPSRSSRALLPRHKVIDVGDFGYAYQLALSGVGVTPCAVFDGSLLGKAVRGLPALPDMRFNIVSEDQTIAKAIQDSLTSQMPNRNHVEAPAATYWQRPARVAGPPLTPSRLRSPDLRPL